MTCAPRLSAGGGRAPPAAAQPARLGRRPRRCPLPPHDRTPAPAAAPRQRGDGRRASRRQLARLTRHRVLARLERQIGGVRAGSSGYVYGLGSAGHRLLRPGRPGRWLHEVRDGFLQHALAVAAIYVRLRQAEQRGELDLLTVQTEPQCWRRLDDLGGADWLKPDLYLMVGVSDDALHSFVEVDQGSEHTPALLRKLRQYETAYRSGGAESSDGVFPRVVWLVPREQRATQLRRLIGRAGLTTELHVVALQADALPALTGDGDRLADSSGFGAALSKLTNGK